MLSLCFGWEFTEQWTEDFALGRGTGEPVQLPHNVRELPLHYADHNAYQTLCGYRRSLEISQDWEGKKIFLQFDGAAHIATVFVNGRELATHRTGYTGFRVDISDAVLYGGDNLLAVKLDTTENGAIPPFGFVIDYLTYGGLYREVWLDVREQSYIGDLSLTTPSLTQLRLQVTAVNAENCRYRVELLEADDRVVLTQSGPATAGPVVLVYPQAKPWDLDAPFRYTCRVTLLGADSTVLDVQSQKFGFRTAEFTENQFLLNGKPTFLRGLNRHQCYPYIGYAAPERLQREDARILKEELGCTVVRTSHYPQSHHFLDECDRLGLLVFTEIPGWQHIGDESWKEQAIENVREMVLQYRNHPSIILWGVRINESQDDNDFYIRTNAVAHALDPSRATSGVRFLKQSSLYEDVYGYNDFSHMGSNPGVEAKRLVTPDKHKPLLITENNGHMFPTKSFDTWQRRQEHALRHARVQNDAAADGEHVGCISWCMFDYATHKDFGSGDRICYHGVMDMFRNPKLAAYLYASQQEQTPVLAMGSSMDIGDYPAGTIGDVYVFTNADEVALYKNDDFVTTLSKGDWKGLPHGPMVLDDRVGCLLETKEGFSKEKADLVRGALNAIGKYGVSGIPKTEIAKIAFAMVKYGMKFQDGMDLYGKYVAGWGGESTVWRLEGRKDGKPVSQIICCPSARLHLEVRVSHRDLTEGDTYDMAAVRVRILDEFGNPAPYAQLPVRFTVSGALQRIGPETVTAEGGMCGAYVRTVGQTGSASLTVSAQGLENVSIDFSIF